jgi:hypothetical protein
LYAKMIAGDTPLLLPQPQTTEPPAAEDQDMNSDIELEKAGGVTPLFLSLDDDSELSDPPDDFVLNWDDFLGNMGRGEGDDMAVDADNDGREHGESMGAVQADDLDVDAPDMDGQPGGEDSKGEDGKEELEDSKNPDSGTEKRGDENCEGLVDKSSAKSYEIAGIVGYTKDKVCPQSRSLKHTAVKGKFPGWTVASSLEGICRNSG